MANRSVRAIAPSSSSSHIATGDLPSNVLLHPTWGNEPVVNKGSPGRRPQKVANLTRARQERGGRSRRDVSSAASAYDNAASNYDKLYKAALEKLRAGPDAEIYSLLEALETEAITLAARANKVQSTLLYRADPEFERFVRGGQ